MPSIGRPRNEEETCVISLRLPVALRDQLDRHINQLEQELGIKASRTDMLRHALRRYLEAAQAQAIEIPPTLLTRRDLLLEYFTTHPNIDLSQQTIAEWARNEYPKRTGQQFRGPERQIRALVNKGVVTKVSAGVYRYNLQER